MVVHMVIAADPCGLHDAAGSPCDLQEPNRCHGDDLAVASCRPMTDTERFTPSGVRLRRRATRPGRLHWMLVPGGPGVGSESLHELADSIEVPGTTWMVDLPGDGSNVSPPGVTGDPFRAWPQVLLEAVETQRDVVVVGHSTGGMYLLSTPALEERIVGLALLGSAPSAAWMARFEETVRQDPLPAVTETSRLYEAERTPERLRDVVLASLPWNFSPEGVEAGREMFLRLPINPAAVDWSEAHFDRTYVAKWWPRQLPTLVMSGERDRIVDQSLWREERFHGPHVLHRTAPGAGHFSWIERPGDVRAAFHELAVRAEAYAASR
jgi:pimeloyl-ACP methyl ester carboxylesterase